MTAQIPPQLEGTHAPSTFEIFWEKHRRTAWTIVVAAAFALGLNYGVKYYIRSQVNAEWSEFAAVTHLPAGYNPTEGVKGNVDVARSKLASALVPKMTKADSASIDQHLPGAKGPKRAFLLWAAACQAIMKSELDRSASLLEQLEREFPSQSLCVETDYPVQFRKPVKEEAKPAPGRDKKPKLEPEKRSSMTGQVKAQIAGVRSYQAPAHFQQQPIPEGSPRFRVNLKGELGGFTIALLPSKAPKVAEQFQRLAQENYWNGMRIDQIVRTGTRAGSDARPMEFHFGLETSRNDDRSLWISSEPSKHQVEFEDNDLSHFPGAVAAMADGAKASVDRIWVCVDDNVYMDRQRVIFAYVVDGMDVLRRIGDTGFVSQTEEETGQGKPLDYITIESVVAL